MKVRDYDQLGGWTLGKPSFEVHRQLAETFLSAYKYKFKDATPKELGDKADSFHESLVNARKKTALPHFRVSYHNIPGCYPVKTKLCRLLCVPGTCRKKTARNPSTVPWGF